MIKLPVKPNPLAVFLFGLGQRLEWLSKHSEAFQEGLKFRSFRMGFYVKSEFVGAFVVENNQFHFSDHESMNESLELHFSSGTEGVKLMVLGAEAMLQGMANKRLVLQGDLSLLLWLGQITEHVPPKLAKDALDKLRALKP